MTNPNLGQPVKNKNKVPVVQWRKWSNHAKRIFNDVFYSMRPSMQRTLNHPEAFAMPKEHWATLRWNAAWLAASAVKKDTARMAGVVQDGKVYRDGKGLPRKAPRRGK